MNSGSVDKHKDKAFDRFLKIPGQSPSGAAAPTLSAPKFTFRLLRKTKLGVANDSDMWSLVHLSHNCPRIRRANDMSSADRFGLYSLWFEANPQSILLLERHPADKAGTSIVGSTIILPLQKPDFDLIASGALPVVKLPQERICKVGAAFDLLLFDTWVMHNDYQDFEKSWFFSANNSHQGFGNVLPLRHLALFWGLPKQTSIDVYAEPDSLSMQKLLGHLGFQVKSTTAIGEPLLHLQYPPTGNPTAETALDRRRLKEIVSQIEQCGTWPLVP